MREIYTKFLGVMFFFQAKIPIYDFCVYIYIQITLLADGALKTKKTVNNNVKPARLESYFKTANLKPQTVNPENAGKTWKKKQT